MKFTKATLFGVMKKLNYQRVTGGLYSKTNYYNTRLGTVLQCLAIELLLICLKFFTNHVKVWKTVRFFVHLFICKKF